MVEKLLPHYFKKVAIFSCVLAIVLWAITSANPELLNIPAYLLDWTFKTVILLSLVVYVFTREKIETERISRLRRENIQVAFVTGVLFLIVDPILEMLYAGENFELMSGYELMMVILLVYSLRFFIKKNIKTVVRA